MWGFEVQHCHLWTGLGAAVCPQITSSCWGHWCVFLRCWGSDKEKQGHWNETGLEQEKVSQIHIYEHIHRNKGATDNLHKSPNNAMYISHFHDFKSSNLTKSLNKMYPSSIHIFLSGSRVALEPIPAGVKDRRGHQRITGSTHRHNLESPIKLTLICTCLDWGSISAL